MHAPITDLAPLEKILEEFKGQTEAVIPILQRAQDVYGYLPKAIMWAISRKAGLPLSRLYGVATFYAQFRLTPRGRHLIRICDGTACHVRGAPKIVEEVGAALQLQPGGSDADFKYALEIVYCVGSCGLAPVTVVDDKVYGQTKAERLIEAIKQIGDETGETAEHA